MPLPPPPRGTTVYKDVDVDTFPARLDTRGSKILGGLAVLIGGGFASMPLIAAGKALATEGWSRDMTEAMVWFALPFALFLWLALWGVNQWLSRLTVLMDRSEVRWVRRSLRGIREEAEPLGAYDGIRRQDRFDSDDGQLWELLLQHPDPAKTVLLYQANRYAGLTGRWRAFCQAFQLRPVDCLAPDEPIVLAVEDLGRSIIDLVRDGRVVVPDPGPVPPPDVGVTSDDRGEPVVTLRDGSVVRADVDGLRLGSDGRTVLRAGVIDAITIEPGVRPLPKPVLRVAYRRTFETEGQAPDTMLLSVDVASRVSLPALRWVQRWVLRRLAGLPSAGTAAGE